MHRLRQLDPHGLAIEKFHFDLQVGNQVVDRVPQNLFGQMRLLVIRRVHEVVAVSVVVQVLHLDFIDVDFFNRIGRTEAVLEHRAGAQVAQLGLDEGAQVAGSAVFDAEHGVQIIVVLDDHTGTELCGRDRHR